MKLCAEMLSRFQWQMENSSQELHLSPGFMLVTCRYIDLYRRIN